MAQLKRLNWQKWLYPWEAELQTDQAYREEKRKRHLSKEHTSGIVEGLAVLATGGTPNLFVHVQTGRAIDQAGNDIILESVVDLDLSSYAAGGGTAYIVAEFDETLSDGYIVPEIAATQYKYYEETPIITHQGTAPTGNQIELARVVVTNGATQIVNSADPLDPANNEIKHVYREVCQPAIDGVPAGYKVLDPSRGAFLEQLALLGCSPGDRFWLLPGSYPLDNNGVPHPYFKDTFCKNITISGSRDAIVYWEDTHWLYINAEGVTFDGITLRSAGGTGTTTMLYLNATATRTTFRNIYFEGTSGGVRGGYVVALDAIDITIENCEFNNYFSSGALQLTKSGGGCVNARVLNCKFDTSAVQATTQNCLFLSGTTIPPITVRDCEFTLADPPATQGRYGIVGIQSGVIENCTFTGNGHRENGVLYTDSTAGLVVKDCVGTGLGFFIYCDYNFYDVLVDNCDMTVTDTSELYGVVDLSCDIVNATIRNCRFTGKKWGIREVYAAPVIENFQILNNRITISTASTTASQWLGGVSLKTSTTDTNIGSMQIVGNEITCTYTGATIADCAGIILYCTDNTQIDLFISKNKIKVTSAFWGIGIYTYAISNANTDRNALLSDNSIDVTSTDTGTTAQCGGLYIVSCTNFVIRACNGIVNYGTDTAATGRTSWISVQAGGYHTITSCVFRMVRTNAGATSVNIGIWIAANEIVLSGCEGSIGGGSSGAHQGVTVSVGPRTRHRMSHNAFTTISGWTTGIFTNSCTYSSFSGNLVAGTITLGSNSVKGTCNAEGV